jgi:hypothetical protein
MKNIFNKKTLSSLLVFLLAVLVTPLHHIFATLPPINYTPLAPLPGFTSIDVTDVNGLSIYLNTMIALFIGICAVLAVIMIVLGGIQYATSELISSKEAGKERIRNALFGLLLALGSWLILNTINPDLLNTNPLASHLTEQTITAELEEQIKTYTGRGTCTPVTKTGPCTVSSLTNAGFTNSTQASSICNGESGGNPELESGVDKCSDGNSFSFGLFQINAIAHANEIPGGVCSGVFSTSGGGTQGSCLESRNGICIKRNCTVINYTKLQSCKNYLKNPTNNISYAAALQSSRGWGQWGANASCHF